MNQLQKKKKKFKKEEVKLCQQKLAVGYLDIYITIDLDFKNFFLIFLNPITLNQKISWFFQIMFLLSIFYLLLSKLKQNFN